MNSTRGEDETAEIRCTTLEIRTTKSEIRNVKFKQGRTRMGTLDRFPNQDNSKKYDLEERTFCFARSVRAFVKRVPRSLAHHEDLKQLIRSSGSVGANYIEANEALSRRDFVLRIRICRKEAKESHYWLRLLELGDKTAAGEERARLAKEAWELMNIFGAILRKSEANSKLEVRNREVNSKLEVRNPKADG